MATTALGEKPYQLVPINDLTAGVAERQDA